MRIDGALERLRHLVLPPCRSGRLLHPRAEVADDDEGEWLAERRLRIGEGAEVVAIDPIALHQPLDLRIPVPAHAASPQFVLHRDAIGVARVRLQPRDCAVIARVRLRLGDEGSGLVADFHARRPIRRRPAADRLAPRRMHPLQILVVHELRPAVGARLEIKRAPRNQGRLVRQPRKVDIRFRMKLRHCDIVRLRAQGAGREAGSGKPEAEMASDWQMERRASSPHVRGVGGRAASGGLWCVESKPAQQ